MKLICQYCAVGFHDLCYMEGQECCCGGEGFVDSFSLAGLPERGRPGAKPKMGEDMHDVLSTGRKRAAALLPDKFLATIQCQWQSLKYAGGGIQPIVGCTGNQAVDRHHGPDKSTINNDDQYSELGHNLHGICRQCHRRWHVCNDKFYGKGKDDRPAAGQPWLPDPQFGECKPHDRITIATDDDRDNFLIWFKSPEKKRGRYE